MVGVYATYGQYHADPSAEETVIYYRIPEEEGRWVISSILSHALPVLAYSGKYKCSKSTNILSGKNVLFIQVKFW